MGVHEKSLKSLEKTAFRSSVAGGTWWTGERRTGDLDKGVQWKWGKQVRAESKKILSEKEKKTTLSFIIAYMIASKSLHSAYSAIYKWMSSFLQVLSPSTLPCAFCAASTLCTVSPRRGTRSCICAPNTFPPLSPPHLRGKVLFYFWTFKCHSFFYEKFANTPLPTSTHHTQQAEVIAFPRASP